MELDRLERVWRRAWAKPDRRPIHAWAKDNIVLPPSYAQPGPLHFETSRHLIAPLEAIQSDTVREVSCCGAIQTGKTLIVEAALAYFVANSPGPIMWTLQTDDDAREHCNQRFMSMLMEVPAVKELLPEDRHKKTSTDIYFGPFFLNVNGANLNNLQRVSVRYKLNSEVWLWKPGLLAHARGRVSAFERAGNSKVVNESQGGTDGDDFHEAWNEGHRAVWSVRCFGCRQLAPLEFSGADDVKDKRAFVVWDQSARRDDGTWDIKRAGESARWACPHCGHEHADTAVTRARWNAEGEYVDGRTDAPDSNRSFRWTALVARDMRAMVEQFLNARRAQKQGVDQAMMDFKRQRCALPWKENNNAEAIEIKAGGYMQSECSAAKIDNERVRFLTVDKQRDHYWCVARAWRTDGSSRRLYFSRLLTIDQAEEVRLRFGIEPQHVFLDAQYFTAQAYDECHRFGFTALHGSGQKSFIHHDQRSGRKISRPWSPVQQAQVPGGYINYVFWASEPVKDVLHKLRAGLGAAWEVPADVEEEYRKQMNGDAKREVVNKASGRSEWRWVKVGENHGWDCEAMQTSAALMLRVLAAPTEESEEVKK